MTWIHIDILGTLPNLFTVSDELTSIISDLLVNHYFTCVVKTGLEPAYTAFRWADAFSNFATWLFKKPLRGLHGVKTLGSSVNVFHILFRVISGFCSVPFPNLRPFLRLSGFKRTWKWCQPYLLDTITRNLKAPPLIVGIMCSQLLGSHHIIGIIKRDSNPPYACMPTNAFVAHSLSNFQITYIVSNRGFDPLHPIMIWCPCMTAHDCTSLSKVFAVCLYEQI